MNEEEWVIIKQDGYLDEKVRGLIKQDEYDGFIEYDWD